MTIIVLLILAGISIATLKDSELFKKTQNASIESKIADIEEVANLVYLELKVSEYQNKINGPTISDVVEELINKGYKIKKIEKLEEPIVGISLKEDKIVLAANGTNYITVELKEDTIYNKNGNFIQIDEKYYEITLTENVIKIQRTPIYLQETEIEAINEKETLTLKATSDNENVIIDRIEGNVITVKSKTEETTSEISIIYGKYEAKCEVKVNPNLTKFSVTNYKIDVDNDGDYSDDWNVLYEGEEGLFLIASKCIDYTKYPKNTMIEHGYGTFAYSETRSKVVSPFIVNDGFSTNKNEGYIANLERLCEFPGNESLYEAYSNLTNEEKQKFPKYGVLWKCNPGGPQLLDYNMWTSFIDADNGDLCMGSPTLELLNLSLVYSGKSEIQAIKTKRAIYGLNYSGGLNSNTSWRKQYRNFILL